jgi:ADP-dependent phosphofructokinase/glucokinase
MSDSCKIHVSFLSQTSRTVRKKVLTDFLSQNRERKKQTSKITTKKLH